MLQPWVKHPSQQHRGQWVRMSFLLLCPCCSRLIDKLHSCTPGFLWVVSDLLVLCLILCHPYILCHAGPAVDNCTLCPRPGPALSWLTQGQAGDPPYGTLGVCSSAPRPGGKLMHTLYVMGSNSHSLMLTSPLFLLDEFFCSLAVYRSFAK